MAIKHTPGPWELRVNPDSYYSAYDLGPVVYGEHSEGNLELISQAVASPHKCDDPECPGNKNRLKLEAAEISWYEGFKAGYTQAKAEEVK